MIVSDHFPSKLTEPLQGLPYYLPKAVIPIAIVGSDGSDAASKAAPATGTTNPSTGTMGTGAAPGSPTSAKATPTAPTATATITSAPQVTVNVSATPAPAGGAAKGAAPIYKLAVTAGKPVIVPDPSEEYYLRYTSDGFADDTLGLHVVQSGLLQSSKGQSVDQTAAVAGAVVQLAAIASGVPGAGGLPVNPFEVGLVLKDKNGHVIPPKTPAKAPEKCLLPTINKSFNYEPGSVAQDDGSEAPETEMPTSIHVPETKPTTPKPTTWLIASDGSDGRDDQHQWVKLTLTETLVPSKFEGVTFETIAANPEHPDPPKGILFRDWANIHVIPSSKAKTVCHVAEMQHRIRDVLLPNLGQKYWENMNRQTLINKQVGLTVQNGMLTGIDLNRPSTVLAWAKLPLTIIAAPFAAIAGASTAATSSTPASGN
jgi:hypothetical protein